VHWVIVGLTARVFADRRERVRDLDVLPLGV
jgi:hypothetical protein